MRIKWSEKAKRLAEQSNRSVDVIEEYLSQNKSKELEAIKTNGEVGKSIVFSIDEDDTIQAEVRLR